MTVNQIFASILLFLLVAYNVPAIPRFFKELLFYRSVKWDMSLDSGQDVPLLKYALRRNLPIGKLKLLVLGGQIVFVLMPFIAAANGMIARQGL